MDKRGYFDKRLLLIPFGIIAVVVTVLLLFFGYNECDDWECFNHGIKNCDRTKFIGGSKMIFEYTIKGLHDDKCEVGVELLQGELNNQDSIKLENQKMVCLLPKGFVMIPESDIGNCHGLLKEGLQDLVIKKLHTYLVQNLGRLNLEMLDVSKLPSN
jgi:hypothetical protein